MHVCLSASQSVLLSFCQSFAICLLVCLSHWMSTSVPGSLALHQSDCFSAILPVFCFLNLSPRFPSPFDIYLPFSLCQTLTESPCLPDSLHFSLTMCLPSYLSISLSVYLAACLCVSLWLSVYLTDTLVFFLIFCLSEYLPASLPGYMSAFLSSYLPV